MRGRQEQSGCPFLSGKGTAKNRGTTPTPSLLPTGGPGGGVGGVACSAVPCLVGVSAKYAAVTAPSC